ncbi:Hypothetical predicted protein [Cloeon dipterum]|uniref:Uncharacterized protein n=1 Tax=Cloeon dipterum TaxID=197152 RepID=A0A8S1DI42_9INSE|nr:Hypothetical predicted protein [Cloeon dipterum]
MASSESKRLKQEKMASFSRLKETYFAHKVHFLNTAKGGATALQVAASIADLDLCRRLVEDGHDVGAACRDFGATALHYAALNKDHGKQLVAYFVSLGLRVDERDNEEEEPIHYALRVDNFQVAQELLEFRNDDAEKGGKNLLHFFVVENNLAFAKAVHENDGYLIKELKRNGKSALHLAAEFANLEMCEWLVEQGVDLHARCQSFWCNKNALHYAAVNKLHGKEVVRYLASLGLGVNQRAKSEETPLHCALREGNVEVARQLLDLGADLKVKMCEDNLMQHCVTYNRLESARFVHENDPNLIFELGKNGKNALHQAAARADLEMCQWLVEQGLDPLLSCLGWRSNVLHFAAFNKLHGREIIRFFVPLGVDLNQKTKYEVTPLNFALIVQNMPVVEELLKHGADLKARRGDKNLLHYFVSQNRLDIAKFVHAKDKSLVGERGEKGRTALHLAAMHSDAKTCSWLVEQGVDPHALTQDGKSAADLVAGPNSHEIRRFLLSLETKS